ncbi:glycosyltransferase family 2 protein [Tellurirhabdus bombi]|uniref:glycosyltransferase family 2 protein n=1 Tax=Tellurirhabdus bombi TaxID=2907205 RepID=UPI001F18DFB2|nr:glycosyltransferase family 2 protein [Tellurirhabdus bombi]
MQLSVIIPTYKRSRDLERLLNSLSTQDLAIYEVIIVVGPGDQESLGIAQSWKLKLQGLKILEAQKPSLVHSLNLGLAQISGEIVCLLDDDVFLPNDWSKKISNAYQLNSDYGAYGGVDRLQIEGDEALSNPSLATHVGVFRWNGLIGNHHRGSLYSPANVDVLKGVNLSFRKSALDKLVVDLKLESQGAEVCTEIDICQRIKKNNYKVIYDNNNYLLHYASPRTSSDNRTNIFAYTIPKRLFNQAYVYAKYRTVYDILFFFIHTTFIGSRYQPGFLWSLILFKQHGLNVLKLPLVHAGSILRGFSDGFKRR